LAPPEHKKNASGPEGNKAIDISRYDDRYKNRTRKKKSVQRSAREKIARVESRYKDNAAQQVPHTIGKKNVS